MSPCGVGLCPTAQEQDERGRSTGLAAHTNPYAGTNRIRFFAHMPGRKGRCAAGEPPSASQPLVEAPPGMV